MTSNSMSTMDLLAALGVVAGAVSGIASVLGLFYFRAPEMSSRRRLYGLGLATSLVTLSGIIAAVLLVWLQRPNMSTNDLPVSPSPVPLSTSSASPIHSPSPQTLHESATPTTKATPHRRPETVLLSTPTRLHIVPVKWDVDADGRQIWAPRDCGYINESGKWQIPPQWDRAYTFYEGLALVRRDVDEGFFYVDEQGRFVMKTTAPMHGGDFAEGLAPAKDLKTHTWGYVDRTGRFAIPATYYLTFEFSEGLGRVQLDENRYGFVNRDGHLTIQAGWSNAGSFSEKLAAVCQSKKWGYIDSNSRVVIPLQWSNAGQFSEGIATVKDRFGCSLIDHTGAVLVKTPYDQIGLFSNGFAIARRGEKFGFINKSGDEVSPFEWDTVVQADRQGASRRIYWNLAKRSNHGMATLVWISPDLNEIWRGDIPLVPSKY